MKVHVLERVQRVPAPLDEVFGFFARPENLAEITPPNLGFQILTPSPIAMKEGAVIDYVVSLGGLPLRWRTLITCHEPPHKFVDEQLSGPYSFWHHTHTFRALPDGGTELGDVVRYALPFGPLGDLAHALVVGRQVAGIFSHRRRVIADRFGRTEDTP
ncbi:MAG: SRPBCC family protein [Candidatus Krumholzibacteriia bacterium]